VFLGMLWSWGRELPWGFSGYDYTPGAPAVNAGGSSRRAGFETREDDMEAREGCGLQS
jgi:hypothetical protein